MAEAVGAVCDGRIRILFLGQCIIYGYETVDHSSTFVSRAVEKLTERFPHIDIDLTRKHLHHPTGLKAILGRRFLFSVPDIVVISVVATFAVKYVRVNLLYEMAPEIVDTARSLARRIEAVASGNNGAAKAATGIDRFLTWRPPLDLDEYEKLVEEAISICQAAGSRVVLLGPGRLNEDAADEFSVSASEVSARFSLVNQMVWRLSKRKGVLVVDAQGTLSDYGGEVFLQRDIRWNRFGHEVVARELESVLASEVIRSISPTSV